MAGASAAAYGLLTDYEWGAVRKIPVPVHLNLDACTGLELLAAAATILHGEPAAGRWTTAALGAYELFAAAATAAPMVPARLVRVRRDGRPAPAARQTAEATPASAAASAAN